MKSLTTFVLIMLMTMSTTLFAVDDAVNVNSADAAEIEKELTGVTETIAERIVAYRETHGPFATIDDLLKVEGIERDIINMNRNNIHVDAYREDDV